MSGWRTVVLVSLLVGLTFLARGDVILDPAEVSKLLAEIGKLHEESTTAKSRTDQLDALYEMGERVLDLSELMNRDLQSHGSNDPNLVELILRRLKEYGIVVGRGATGYQYDLAAFREYLRRAPKGERSADAHYVLVGFDEPGEDPGRLLKSMAGKERFIRAYPRYSEMSVVKFLLAQQHAHLARVYRKQNNQKLSDEQQKIAEGLYRQIVKLYPKSPEAEAAADLLSESGAGK